jgi:hypothetical protein
VKSCASDPTRKLVGRLLIYRITVIAQSSNSPLLGISRSRRHVRDWQEEMPYRISYIDASMLTDEQIKEGILQAKSSRPSPRR